jgi:hypothetical protein
MTLRSGTGRLRRGDPILRASLQHPGTVERPIVMSSSHWTVVWIAFRSVVLIVVGWLLIMVLFPAALVAAGN